MKPIAERLTRYSNKNKVIHIDSIMDVGLRKLVEDREILKSVRSSLHLIDPNLEILIPRQVDDTEKQFKRYLQHQFGLSINLSELKEKYPAKYRKIQRFGKPSEVLTRWGLAYHYSTTIRETDIKNSLNKYPSHLDNISLFKLNKKLYYAVKYYSSKKGIPVTEYLNSLRE